jgi:ribosomal protein S12 methylthiotransferase
VIVVNTCSFIDPAKQESIDTILEMAEYKKTGRAQKLIVAGCLVERYRGDIQKNMPEVDAVIGTNELERSRRCAKASNRKGNPLDALPLSRPHAARAVDAAPLRLHQDRRGLRSSLHLLRDSAISRGKFRSRRFESVISEATRLFAQGVREINLIGQDTTCYGEDFGLKDGLALLAGAAGADRNATRKMGALPVLLSQQSHAETARHHRRARALVKYIDMPLQHASAAVLKRMKRGANGDIFLKLIERIRGPFPAWPSAPA